MVSAPILAAQNLLGRRHLAALICTAMLGLKLSTSSSFDGFLI
jgi:hypothetical protein